MIGVGMNDPQAAQTGWRTTDDAQPGPPNMVFLVGIDGPTHFRIIVSIVNSNRGASNECGDEKSSSGSVVRVGSDSGQRGGYRSSGLATIIQRPPEALLFSVMAILFRASTLHDRICGWGFAMERATRRGDEEEVGGGEGGRRRRW